MDQDFWKKRWESDEIAFHQPLVNPYLEYYFGTEGPPVKSRENLRVFVPLCGKSSDMAWLSQQGYFVTGIEFSEIAVQSFFNENGLEYETNTESQLVLYKSGNIEIYQGDFFKLDKARLKGVTDIYDRAALIALPEPMRRDYVGKINELCPDSIRIMLITMFYPQEEMEGPPFSVSETEVENLYANEYDIEKLCIKDILNDVPRFQEKGLSSLLENVFRLKRK